MTTRGGANSGKTSTCIFGSEVMPRIIRPTAAATIRCRNLRLELMIDRMRVHRGSAGSGADAPAGLAADGGGPEPAGGSTALILPR
jgi:hypothetical protein